MKPNDFLNEAIKAIGDRAAERDIDEERSAERAAHMFSALTGRDMTELEAWQFMCCLKLVRSATGKFKADDFVDLAGYAALAGEAAEKDSKELYPTWDMDYDCIRWTTSPGATDWGKERNDGWIRHDGGKCPVHPADVVEAKDEHGDTYITPPSKIEWRSDVDCFFITHYRPLHDEDGVPYCSPEGLRHWAEYVATDKDGQVHQFSFLPVYFSSSGRWSPGFMFIGRGTPAPFYFTNTSDHWTQTLRRVYRREDT